MDELRRYFLYDADGQVVHGTVALYDPTTRLADTDDAGKHVVEATTRLADTLALLPDGIVRLSRVRVATVAMLLVRVF